MLDRETESMTDSLAGAARRWRCRKRGGGTRMYVREKDLPNLRKKICVAYLIYVKFMGGLPNLRKIYGWPT